MKPKPHYRAVIPARANSVLFAALLSLAACGGETPDGGKTSGDPFKDTPVTTAKLSVSTFAGLPSGPGDADGIGSAARFRNPLGVATDGANVYVADVWNCTVRRIVIDTGSVSTLAGTPRACDFVDGTGTAAHFVGPTSITTDGTSLYVTDGQSVRRIVISSGVVETVAGANIPGSVDGVGKSARFYKPSGITTDGDYLYVADTYNYTVRKIALATGEVTTLAGSPGVRASVDGSGSEARFNFPRAIGIAGGSNLYVIDSGSVRTIDLATGTVSTLNGDWGYFYPSVLGESLSVPRSIVVNGTDIYVTDSGRTIRRVSTPTGSASILAGNPGSFGYRDGVGAAARFANIASSATDGTNLYVTESSSNTIRKIVIATQNVTTLAGMGPGSSDGTGTDARFSEPRGITSDGANLYVSDKGNHTVRKINIATGETTTLAGKAGIQGYIDGIGDDARFMGPGAVMGGGITTDGNRIFLIDGVTVRQIVIATREVSTLAGHPNSVGSIDGIGTNARFSSPVGITTDGTHLYLTDKHAVRKIDLATRSVTTIAGTPDIAGANDGIGAAAQFHFPKGIATDGVNLYVADGNTTLRRIEIATNAVSTLVGQPKQLGEFQVDGGPETAVFSDPRGAAIAGSNLYVTDGNTVRKIEISTGIVTTIAGTHLNDYADGNAAVAQFNTPDGIAVIGESIYVADSGNNIIRIIQ